MCAGCNYAFIDPSTVAQFDGGNLFDDAYFTGGGAGYTDYIAEGEILRRRGARYGEQLVRAGARRVLDVGAAAGFTLLGLQDAGCSAAGIEPNASMARYAADHLGLDVAVATLEQYDSAETFDAIVLLQIVDHLEDLRGSFARIEQLTRPGGLCLVEFGNRASVTARLLGPRWHEYAPPSVRRVFSLRALRRLFGQYGFTLYTSGHPPKYLRADHALSLLRFKSRSAGERRLIDTLLRWLPANAILRYPGDDVAWALFTRVAPAG